MVSTYILNSATVVNIDNNNTFFFITKSVQWYYKCILQYDIYKCILQYDSAIIIPPFHQQEPGASSEPVLLPVLSWFDWWAL